MTTALLNLSFMTAHIWKVNHFGPGSSSLTVQIPQNLDWSH